MAHLDDFQIARLRLRITTTRDQWQRRERERRQKLAEAEPNLYRAYLRQSSAIDDCEQAQSDLDDLLGWLDQECGQSPSAAGMPEAGREVAARADAAPGLTSNGWTVEDILRHAG